MPKSKQRQAKENPGVPAPPLTARARVARLVVPAALAAAAAGVVWAVASRRPAAHLAASVPDDVTAFFEVPSVAGVIEHASSVKGLDPAAATSRAAFESVGRAIGEAFHVPRVDAESLAASVVGVAVASRTRAGAGESGTAVAWLASLSASRGWDAIVESSRFASDGAFGADGKAYRLAKGGAAVDAGLLERSLREASTSAATPRTRLVWFARKRLLVFGDEALVHDVGEVVAGARASLEHSKRLVGDERAAVGGRWVVAGGAMKASAGAGAPAWLVDALAAGAGEASGHADVTPAGLVLDGSVAYGAGGSEPPLAMAAPLTLPARLPAETCLYVATSLARSDKAAGAAATVRRLAAATEPSAAVRIAQAIVELTEFTSVPLDDLLELAGQEAVVALVLRKEAKFDPFQAIAEAAAEEAGLVIALRVDGDAAAQRTVARLREGIARTELGSLLKVAPEVDGWVARSVGPTAAKLAVLLGLHPPEVRVRYSHKELVVVVAQHDLVERTLAALDGTGPALRDEPAYALARSALPEAASGDAWLDVGRVSSLVYAGNLAARADAQARGWPVDTLRLAGPDRVTAALSLSLTPASPARGPSLAIRALNPWSLSLLSGFQAKPERPRPPVTPREPMRRSDASAGAVPPGIASADDMPTCRNVLRGLEHCVAVARTPELRADYQHQLEDRRAAYANVPLERAIFVDKGCLGLISRIQHDKECHP